MKLHKNSSFIQITIGSLVIAALTAFQATAADYSKENKDTTDLKHKDTTFVKQAAEGGMVEVQVGQLAAQKGQNEQIKQLGQRIQTDHTKSNQDLQQLAQKVGVTVPAELDRRHKKIIDDL